ncbi:MAG: thymidine phosphorylase [Pseudorhizobium pelagicum]|uniref:thymidine phosphorylase n=1 Tax=Pseudorhizobium pelagicum TaxID=1509405 RepID=UPI0034616EDA
MIPQEIIRRKRDGQTLFGEEIAAFIDGLTRGDVTEGQAAAFAMAVFFRGMSRDETVALTLAMRDSGDVMTWAGIGRPVADKHSTGGVGDNVSLVLAPLVAACGLAVPMISGRGLGHTGGTLDKLQSIPGYNVAPDLALLQRVVSEAGCAIVGQTGDLAPADRRLYAIRDVTATVESVPLITASILSKKLAAGLETLVLDVKVGNGAFMESLGEAQALARSLVEVANGAGTRTTALLTDMNQPLADAAGNALEVRHAIDLLSGRKSGTRAHDLVLALAAEMLVQAGVATNLAEARQQAERALDGGESLSVFARMVHLLGGPADLVERPDHYLPEAAAVVPVVAQESGWLSACATRDLGLAVIELGGGRKRPQDDIDHAVGVADILPLGSQVSRGDPIAFVHAADRAEGERMAEAVRRCFAMSEEAPAVTPVVIERIT